MTLKKSFKGLNAVVPAGGEIQLLGYGRLLWLEGSQVKAALPARAQRIAQQVSATPMSIGWVTAQNRAG
jgi:hypothetical protein